MRAVHLREHSLYVFYHHVWKYVGFWNRSFFENALSAHAIFDSDNIWGLFKTPHTHKASKKLAGALRTLTEKVTITYPDNRLYKHAAIYLAYITCKYHQYLTPSNSF